MTMSNNGKATKLVYQIILITTTIMTLFPLYFMLANSFKTREQYLKDPVGFPNPFTLQNYIDAFKGKDFMSWFSNSLILTIGAVLLTMIIGIFAAYAFAKLKFKGKTVLFAFIVPMMSIPPVAMLIPLFKLVTALKMVNTLTSVIFIYCGICLPMTVYMMRNFLLSVPDSIIEAAKMDGCSDFRMLFSFILPLSVPAIITSGLVNFVWCWNELMIALVFLQKEKLRTLIVGTTIFKSRYTLNVPVIMAGLVVVTIPVVLVYIFGQKRLVEGITDGAVKE